MAKANKSQAEDYRSYDDQKLTDTLAEQVNQLKRTHFSHAVNPLENPQSIRTMRRNIARMKTEQRRRILGNQ